MRILLVEDEDSIRDVVKLNLEMEAYEIVTADNGRDAVRLSQDQHFDLIILDVMLPEVDGFQVCEQIRLKDIEVPIIFLTAKDASQDRINGLKRGADDYLTKPFALEELLLRVNNLIKRSSKNVSPSLEAFHFGGNSVNFRTYEAQSWEGQRFTLTKKEAMLLNLLIKRRGEVVSRQQILQSVWGYDVYPSTRTIDNFILSFRKYFERDPRNPLFFHSVRGMGYKFSEA